MIGVKFLALALIKSVTFFLGHPVLHIIFIFHVLNIFIPGTNSISILFYNLALLTLSDLGDLKHSMPGGGGGEFRPPLFIFAVA